MNTPHKIEEVYVQSSRKDYLKGSPFMGTALPVDFERDNLDVSFDCGRSSAFDNVAFKDLPSTMHTPVNTKRNRGDRSTAKKMLDFELMPESLSFLDNPFFSNM